MRFAPLSFSLLLTTAIAVTPLAAAPRKPAAKPSAAPSLPVGQIKVPPLSYTILKAGPATGAHPGRGDIVTVNYTLTLLDGKVLDTTEGKAPATFPLGQLIPAWQVMIQLMRPGDVWMLYVPSEYAYGAQAQEGLPANSFLTFKVELISVGDSQRGPIRQDQ